MCHLDTPSDGWVPPQFWEATKSAHKEAFDVVVQTMRDAETADDESVSEEELRKI